MSCRITWAALAAVIVATDGWAGAMYEAPLSACTATNCSSMTIRGIQQPNDPFVIQVFARQGECLRLDVNTQTQDTVLAWVTPWVWDSEIWDDRDFAGGDFRPLFVKDPVPWTGWYTVIISYYDPANITSRFTLKYGRYPSGNANCQGVVATAAASSLKPAADAAGKVSIRPAAGNQGQ